jgi:hypothetical protein
MTDSMPPCYVTPLERHYQLCIHKSSPSPFEGLLRTGSAFGGCIQARDILSGWIERSFDWNTLQGSEFSRVRPGPVIVRRLTRAKTRNFNLEHYIR